VIGVRSTSFGEGHELTFVDKFGTWLSSRRLLKIMKNADGKVVADIGCGYDARFGMSLLARVGRLILVDVSFNPDLTRNPNVKCISGTLPTALGGIESNSVDYVILNSVLEHLDDPSETLRELRRISKSGSGVCFVNVPTWLGKVALESSAFRFHLSPAFEIDDHRRYYSVHELWQALRDAGFMPSEMTVRRHKFGLNANAVCRPR